VGNSRGGFIISVCESESATASRFDPGVCIDKCGSNVERQLDLVSHIVDDIRDRKRFISKTVDIAALVVGSELDLGVDCDDFVRSDAFFVDVLCLGKVFLFDLLLLNIVERGRGGPVGGGISPVRGHRRVVSGVVVVYEELYDKKSIIEIQFMIFKRDKKE
jgi:hypothetical protein